MSAYFSPRPQVVICALAIALLSACSGGPASPPQSKAVAMRVQTQRVSEIQIATSISAWGQIVARDPAWINAPADGMRIERVMVEPGDWVNSGQALIELDARQLETEQVQATQQLARANADAQITQTQLNQARSQLALADEELRRYRSVADSGAVSPLDLSAREHQREQLADAWQAAQRNAAAAMALQSSAQAAMVLGRSRANERVLRAPFSGVISERRAEVGALSGGDSGPLLKLARADDREFEALLDANLLASVQIGWDASVQVDGQSYQGRVRSIERALGSDSRRARLRISLSGESRPMLGAAASAQFTPAARRQFDVPATALMFEPAPIVYVVDTQHRLRKRAVRLSADDSAVIEGVQSGELVVSHAPSLLSAGQFIEPVITAPSKPAPDATIADTSNTAPGVKP